MNIEVWKWSLLKGYRKTADQLTLHLNKGANWRSWPTRGTRINVSHELLADELGAKEVPCPHNGEQPVYGRFKTGYICYEKSSGEDCNTVEICTVCGYFTVYPGNPRFRAAMTDEYSTNVHPERSYLDGRLSAIITKAGWHDNCLTTPSYSDDTLIIWVKGRWHWKKDKAKRAAQQAFPDAKVLCDRTRYLILRTASVREAVPAKTES